MQQIYKYSNAKYIWITLLSHNYSLLIQNLLITSHCNTIIIIFLLIQNLLLNSYREMQCGDDPIHFISHCPLFVVPKPRYHHLVECIYVCNETKPIEYQLYLRLHPFEVHFVYGIISSLPQNPIFIMSTLYQHKYI